MIILLVIKDLQQVIFFLISSVTSLILQKVEAESKLLEKLSPY